MSLPANTSQMISDYGAIETNTDDQEKNNDLESNTDSENINDKKINLNKVIGHILFFLKIYLYNSTFQVFFSQLVLEFCFPLTTS